MEALIEKEYLICFPKYRLQLHVQKQALMCLSSNKYSNGVAEIGQFQGHFVK